MKSLHIEWLHIGASGELSLYCADTGQPLNEVIKNIKAFLGVRGVDVTFSEGPLPKCEENRSHIILLNNTSLEELVPVRVPKSPCAHCSCCDGTDAVCTSGERDWMYDEVPESVLRLAAMKASGLK